MNNRLKIVLAAGILFLLAAGAVAAVYVWPRLKGATPALAPPPADIGALLEVEGGGIPAVSPPANDSDFPLTLPDGFRLSLYARDLGRVRVMVDAPGGAILASLMDEGRVAALPDADGDGRADQAITLLDRLNNPHGLALWCPGRESCRLFVAETDKVSVFDYDPTAYRAASGKAIISLPPAGGHYTRTVVIKKIDGQPKLLISVGSSCNVCYEEDWRRAAVLSANLDGSGLELYASGLRNSVFLAEHPVSGEIYATEMGRDWLGDDLPPEEVNIIRPGGDYGWPVCYGQNINDRDFDQNEYVRDPCADKEPPVIEIPAHSAPLGIAFFPAAWPAEYRFDALVAYHGSWNRTVPTGYKVVRVKLDEAGRHEATEDFLAGWLLATGALGRPVDILIRPEREIFISDDKAGVIYRLVYAP